MNKTVVKSITLLSHKVSATKRNRGLMEGGIYFHNINVASSCTYNLNSIAGFLISREVNLTDSRRNISLSIKPCVQYDYVFSMITSFILRAG